MIHLPSFFFIFRFNSSVSLGLRSFSKLSLLVVSICWLFSVSAQTFQNLPLQDWVTYQGAQYMFQEAASTTDPLRNVYVIGSTVNGLGNYDILVVKYDRNGVELWNDQIDGSYGGDDFAADLVIDGSGDLIVTGAVENGPAENYDLWIRKYGSNGTVLWTDEYDGTAGSYDGGTCITTDAFGNVYVGGGTSTTSGTIDFLTRKYNSNGVVQWTSTWDYSGLYDAGLNIRASGGVVSIVGGVQVNFNTWRFAVLGYNANSGALTSSHISTGGTSTIDQVRDFAVDDQNNSYVIGGVEVPGQGYDIKLVKLNTNLIVQWEKTINGSDNLDDMGEALHVDNSGNVFISGYLSTTTNDKDVVVRKYNSAGVLQWEAEYNGHASGKDEGKAIEVNAAGEVYVGATSFTGHSDDLLLLKYTNSGSLEWETGFNGIANKHDAALDLALDDDENIIITGSSEHLLSTRFVTIRYIEREVITPPDEEDFHALKVFRENLGQLRKSDGTSASEIVFNSPATSPATFVAHDRISYVLSSLDTAQNDTLHRVDFSFNKLNRDQKFYGVDKQGYYESFYHSSIHNKSREMVRTFGALYKPEVYPNIDLRLAHNEVGSKIYFICKSGFASTSLKFEMAGHDSVYVAGGDLVISTSLGDFAFVQGEAYELTSAGTRIDLGWQSSFNVVGNEVSLGLGTFNTANVLVIEIDQGNGQGGGGSSNGNQQWSTFLGTSNPDRASQFDVAPNGELYCAGSVFQGFFPEFIGFGTDEVNGFGSYDAYIIKMGPQGEPEWGFYYGSGLPDYGNEVVADAQGNSYLAGSYDSAFGTNSLPLTENGFQPVSGGGIDGFVVKVNAGGMLDWASYFGGTGTEHIHDMQLVPPAQGVVIVGTTLSLSGLPLEDSGGYFRDVTANGSVGQGLDGFITQINADGGLEWSTHFGAYSDGGYTEIGGAAIADESPSRLVITGNTQGSAGPIQSSPQSDYTAGFPICDPGNGAYIQNSSSSFDAFIAEFDLGSHELIWSTLFGGGGDESFGAHGEVTTMTFQGNNYDAISGTVTSTTGFDFETPFSNSYFQNSPVGETDVFVASFKNRDLHWSTFVGGDDLEVPYGMGYDRDLNLFVVGKTDATVVSSPIDYCLVPNAGEFALCDGGGDLYIDDDAITGNGGKGFILTFNSQYQLVWSTLYGGSQDDRINGLGIDALGGALYVCGSATSSFDNGFPLNPWLFPISHFDPQIGGRVDAFMARFAINTIVSTEDLEAFGGLRSLFSAHPNPATEQITIVGVPQGTLQVEVYSTEGKRLHTGEWQAGLSSYRINTSLYPPGMYLVQLTNDHFRETLKISVVK